jgi:hypothetical protein
LAQFAQATYIAEYNQIWFAVPSGDGLTGNNMVLAYSIDDGIWEILPIAARAFGNYERQAAWTWEDLPYATWQDWGWTKWDTVENVVGWPYDIASDYCGCTFDLHSAENDSEGDPDDLGEIISTTFTAKLILGTDLSSKHQGMDTFKRINEISILLNRADGSTINLYVREDDAAAWTLIGSVSLTGHGRVVRPYLSCDVRTKFLEIKIEATNYFELLGLFFDFSMDGTR